jgi:spermidine/putrescine transport system substrate-binding protein
LKMSRLLLSVCFTVSLSMSVQADDPELIVTDWPGFDAEGMYATYKEKWGVRPTYAFVTSDDETFQKAISGFGADVSHPCAQMVPKYREVGLIEPWDVSRIPEFKNIMPEFLASPIIQDEAGVWIIPADWGATAIAYNAEMVPAEDIATLQVFADPKYAGKITMPNASDDVWALAYLATGVTDWTNVTDDQFNTAADWLRKVHPGVRAYVNSSTEMAQLMKSGEVMIAWSWPDGLSILQKEGFPVGYQRTPKEGVTTWFCGLVNLKNGKGSEDKAYDYVNSWIRPEAAEVLVTSIGYGHANAAGMQTLDPAVLDAAGLGPIDGPTLPQLPFDLDQRQRQLETFDRIKAGF